METNKNQWNGDFLLTDVIVIPFFQGEKWGSGRWTCPASSCQKLRQPRRGSQAPWQGPGHPLCSLPALQTQGPSGGFLCSWVSLSWLTVLFPGWGLEGNLNCLHRHKLEDWLSLVYFIGNNTYHWLYNAHGCFTCSDWMKFQSHSQPWTSRAPNAEDLFPFHSCLTFWHFREIH